MGAGDFFLARGTTLSPTEKPTDMPEFDLTPHPRILPMLGEIVLPQWRCLAELIDNSVDAFLEASRTNAAVSNPKVVINIPTRPSPDAQISIKDNGPGMDAATLERAARAGWTSHDPINNLGLFGMGFNIATARLGMRTTIWTTQAGSPKWTGLEIDFERLQRSKKYTTPVLVDLKTDPSVSGTRIVIDRLKPDQLEWFSKSANRTAVSKNLGRTYSSMLRTGGTPIQFALEVNATAVRPKVHCVWGGPGNPDRKAESPRYGSINAFQEINADLGQRPFCTQCWNWLGATEETCPQCAQDGKIVRRDRKIRGWIGIQRYLDPEDYGIDFLRNGRKIEIGNKDLFFWVDPSTEDKELEYPIDDPRNRGRIVGEIHIDHCRVPYTKDRFVREDAAWAEMTEVVRGKGPLRPDISRERGLGENVSFLSRLFQAYRRSSPHNRNAGGWTKLLVVPDNGRAMEMAKRYDAGEAEYLTDAKWYELADEEDNRILLGTTQNGGNRGQGGQLGGGQPGGAQPQPNPPTGTGTQPPPATPVPAFPRQSVASLSQTYNERLSSLRFDVRAFSVLPNDPDLQGRPWNIRRAAQGHWDFLFDSKHSVFSSATLTPLDALLLQLAWQAADFSRGRGTDQNLPATLMHLREDYAGAYKLDPAELTSEARQRIATIAQSVVNRVDRATLETFFNNLGPAIKERIQANMAQRMAHSPQDTVQDGRFLQYAPAEVVAGFVTSNPEEFFDGKHWSDRYANLNYGAANEIARTRLKERYSSLLSDVVWLSEQSPDELSSFGREQLLRASLATILLAPTAPAAIS